MGGRMVTKSEAVSCKELLWTEVHFVSSKNHSRLLLNWIIKISSQLTKIVPNHMIAGGILRVSESELRSVSWRTCFAFQIIRYVRLQARPFRMGFFFSFHADNFHFTALWCKLESQPARLILRRPSHYLGDYQQYKGLTGRSWCWNCDPNWFLAGDLIVCLVCMRMKTLFLFVGLGAVKIFVAVVAVVAVVVFAVVETEEGDWLLGTRW